jgi:glycosyltransferase involved in cell wall biosynthesis
MFWAKEPYNSMKRKVLIITNHRKDRSPGQRFRFEQYLDFLSSNGYELHFSNLFNEDDDRKLYSKGSIMDKFLIYRKCLKVRKDNLKNINDYDIIFIFREAIMTGSIKFEKAFSKSRAKLIYDFDDAIWIPNVSDANKRFEFLKDSSKTGKIIELCDMVFAGNQYLADYASKFNNNVKIVPTTIDTDEYIKQKVNKSDKICIGWSGSITTIQHFEYAIPFLRELKNKFGDQIEFKVIGDVNYVNEELSIKGLAWNKQTEIRDLSTFDIGIMPLPDDEWANGKCGLKGLQYMALEIPTIMSPIGVNSEIINDGINGFLASEINEWVDKISLLIRNENLRKSIGFEARKTVNKKYSVHSTQNKYLEYFNQLISLD